MQTSSRFFPKTLVFLIHKYYFIIVFSVQHCQGRWLVMVSFCTAA